MVELTPNIYHYQPLPDWNAIPHSSVLRCPCCEEKTVLVRMELPWQHRLLRRRGLLYRCLACSGFMVYSVEPRNR